ncbi:SIS domain-containing protein [Olsenella sp. CA-Schmier-601-WT-1]|uniref:SIS domain-containing protein n=2 Tax=Olsenella porci TaxID=2652279 RepID=A0A6N7XDM4_9ACTN|nr:SIS domain-containing protein [Olsenella porci]
MPRKTMLDYVRETPQVLNGQIAQDMARPLADAFLGSSYDRVRIVACGSSKNAAMIARPYLRRSLGREVIVTEPYTFCAYEHELPASEFTFVVSQSGYSTNALAALDLIRSFGMKALGVTGDANSDFRQAADALFDYGVGNEEVGYVTKGVTSLVVFLWLFGIDVALGEGRLSTEERSREIAKIEALVPRYMSVLEQAPLVLEHRYKELSSMERTFLIGAGTNYGISCEGALKFGECLQIPAIPLELEEYLHGPNLQLAPTYTVFVNAVGASDRARAREIVEATRLVTDHVFVLTDDRGFEGATVTVDPLESSLLAPLSLLPFYQVLAYQLTEDKHLWHKHPLVARFDRRLSGKSDNYVDKEVL